MAIRATKDRASQHETAESLAHGIHRLQTKRGHISADEANRAVFVATEKDLHNDHAGRLRKGVLEGLLESWRSRAAVAPCV